MKVDPSGNIVWVTNGKQISSSNPFSFGGIGIDEAGYIYITSSYADTVGHIGSFNLVNSSPGWTDMFLAKYDPSGNVV